MLFESATIGSLRLRNRTIRSATAERLASETDGSPHPQLSSLYEELATGGVGAIITGHLFVDRDGKAHPEMGSLASDAVVEPWAATIAGARRIGVPVLAQVNHSGAGANSIINPAPGSPSGVRTNPETTPRAFDGREIARVVRAFGRAAGRARQSGFDGVQIHAAHGYLVSQFLSPATNFREDEWGGSAESRRRFVLEVVESVRESVGADFPVWLKLGVADGSPTGLTIEEGCDVAAAAFEAGVDCIEVSHGLGVPEYLSRSQEALLLPLAEAVRGAVGDAPALALVNGLRTPKLCEELLGSGVVQLTSFCRPFIAEPGFVSRWRSGSEDPVACVRCDRCWPEGLGVGVRCNNDAVREAVGAASPVR